MLDLDAVHRADCVDDAREVLGVRREDRDVAHLFRVLDPDEVDRVQEAALFGDRLGDRGERARPVREVQPHGGTELRRRVSRRPPARLEPFEKMGGHWPERRVQGAARHPRRAVRAAAGIPQRAWPRGGLDVPLSDA